MEDLFWVATTSPEEIYFFAAGLAFLAGAAALGAAFAFAATGAATGAALSAVRWSRKALISAPSLFLRSVNFAILAVSFSIALAVLDTGAFFAGAFAATFFAGAFTLEVVFAAFGAAFFAVAMVFLVLLCCLDKCLARALLSSIFTEARKS